RIEMPCSAIGYRLSAIGYQLSAIGYRLSALVSRPPDTRFEHQTADALLFERSTAPTQQQRLPPSHWS
ncbi:MAG: hypothetical protein EI684_21500, partial [Candidatus Viridilinea halotolerans]